MAVQIDYYSSATSSPSRVAASDFQVIPGSDHEKSLLESSLKRILPLKLTGFPSLMLKM